MQRAERLPLPLLFGTLALEKHSCSDLSSLHRIKSGSASVGPPFQAHGRRASGGVRTLPVVVYLDGRFVRELPKQLSNR